MLRGKLIAMAEEWNRQVFDCDVGEFSDWISAYRAGKTAGLKLDDIWGAKPQSLAPGADMLNVRDYNFGCVFAWRRVIDLIQRNWPCMLTKSFLHQQICCIIPVVWRSRERPPIFE